MIFKWLFDGFNDVKFEGSLLEYSLGLYDGTVLGSFDETKDELSTMGLSPGYTEGEALGSEEGMVTGSGEILDYILVAAENVKFGLDYRDELGSLTGSLEGLTYARTHCTKAATRPFL